MLMVLCLFFIVIIFIVVSIGIWVVVILLFVCLLQGFVIGGEYGVSVIYMFEVVILGCCGFLFLFYYVILVGGYVLVQLILLLMLIFWGKLEIFEWGWCIVFGIGGIVVVVVFWLCWGMDELLLELLIEVVCEGKVKKFGLMYELFVYQWWLLLLCFLIIVGGIVVFYIYLVNGLKMIQSVFVGNDLMIGILINLGVLVFLMVLQLVGGWLLDIIGCKILLVFFGVGGVLYSWYLIIQLLYQYDVILVFLILVLVFVIFIGYILINVVVKVELFFIYVCVLGVGLGYVLVNLLFGGIVLLLYQGVLKIGYVDWFVIYVIVMIVVLLVVYVFFFINKGLNWFDGICK